MYLLLVGDISSERINGSLAYLRGSLFLIGWIYALKQLGWSSSDCTGSEHSLELRFLNHTLTHLTHQGPIK